MRDLTPAEKLVDEVLAKQRAKGRAKYGQGLDAGDCHDWPMEALQELADATQYLVAEVVRLRKALDEALYGWADAAQYKGDHLHEKHGDAEGIARLRALLTKEAPDA